MTGSLQIKNDRYYMVINTTDETGKRRQKWLATGLKIKGNKKRADKMLRDTITAYEIQNGSKNANIRYCDWVEYWLADVKKRVDIITHEGYVAIANAQVVPYFRNAKISLGNVTRELLQRYIDSKAASGRCDGGALSPGSIRAIRNILNQSLKAALHAGLITTNPCEGLRLPKREHRESTFYTSEQITSLFDAICGDPFEPLVRVAAIYGLRRSELLGLKWGAIDFHENTLTVQHTVVQQTTLVAKDKTKNAASRRSLPLTREIRELLKKLQIEEIENRRLCGRDYVDTDYVFKWSDGRPYAPHYVSRKFRSLLTQHDLPPIRFHDLRHSCASLLIGQGFGLKDVQEWLGHADITLTANTYAHLDMKRKRSIADSLAGLC